MHNLNFASNENFAEARKALPLLLQKNQGWEKRQRFENNDRAVKNKPEMTDVLRFARPANKY